MKKHNGFIDPISLISLGFLVLGLIVTTAIVKNPNIKLDLRNFASTGTTTYENCSDVPKDICTTIKGCSIKSETSSTVTPCTPSDCTSNVAGCSLQNTQVEKGLCECERDMSTAKSRADCKSSNSLGVCTWKEPTYSQICKGSKTTTTTTQTCGGTINTCVSDNKCLGPGEDCCENEYFDNTCGVTETRCGVKPSPSPSSSVSPSPSPSPSPSTSTCVSDNKCLGPGEDCCEGEYFDNTCGVTETRCGTKSSVIPTTEPCSGAMQQECSEKGQHCVPDNTGGHCESPTTTCEPELVQNLSCLYGKRQQNWLESNCATNIRLVDDPTCVTNSCLDKPDVCNNQGGINYCKDGKYFSRTCPTDTKCKMPQVECVSTIITQSDCDKCLANNSPLECQGACGNVGNQIVVDTCIPGCLGDNLRTCSSTGTPGFTTCPNGCDSVTKTCKPKLFDIGAACTNNLQCQSGYCMNEKQFAAAHIGAPPAWNATTTCITAEVSQGLDQLATGIAVTSGAVGVATGLGALSAIVPTTFTIANLVDDTATGIACAKGDQNACAYFIPALANPIPGMGLVSQYADDLASLFKPVNNYFNNILSGLDFSDINTKTLYNSIGEPIRLGNQLGEPGGTGTAYLSQNLCTGQNCVVKLPNSGSISIEDPNAIRIPFLDSFKLSPTEYAQYESSQNIVYSNLDIMLAEQDVLQQARQVLANSSNPNLVNNVVQPLGSARTLNGTVVGAITEYLPGQTLFDNPNVPGIRAYDLEQALQILDDNQVFLKDVFPTNIINVPGRGPVVFDPFPQSIDVGPIFHGEQFMYQSNVANYMNQTSKGLINPVYPESLGPDYTAIWNGYYNPNPTIFNPRKDGYRDPIHNYRGNFGNPE